MLVKIKQGDTTTEYDSKDVAIAILFTPSDKEIVEKMEHNDLLFLSAPFKVMAGNEAEVWKWAFNDWKGATYVDPHSVISKPQQMRKF